MSLNYSQFSDSELLSLRLDLEVELRKRKISFNVGTIGEQLALQHFKKTPGLPILQLAPPGTKNVDALSRNGERFSIKTQVSAKKTGTIYPDPNNQQQLFEYLLIVRLNEDLSLNAIYQFTWVEFLTVRSWDKRMNAWYVGCSNSTLNKATRVF